MKWFIAIVLLAACAYSVSAKEFHLTEDEFEEQFHVLINDPEAKEKAAEQLSKVEEEINKVNKDFDEGKGTYTEKLYPESILPPKEFEKEKEGAILPETTRRALGAILPPAHIRDDPVNAAKMNEIYRKLAMNRNTLPESFNGVEQGLVTSPKNQGACGSCAAFAAHGLHETCMLKAGAPFSNLDLSEQYIIDCGYNGGSMNGCNGAYVHSYSQWFADNGGQSAHEGVYPYLGKDPLLNCGQAQGSEWNSGAKVDTAVYDYGSDADKLKALLVENGAIMIALHVDSGFSNYESGIYDGCTNTQINHGVLLVGYGTENGVDYWLVKNSWGANWGENGYIKLKRGVNMCGMEGISVITTCSGTGEDAEPAPEPPTAAPIPTELYCDISGLYGPGNPGPGITGNYNVQYSSSNGEVYYSEVSCEDSTCTPRSPGPSNACMYICGKLKCTESTDDATTQGPEVTTQEPEVTTQEPEVTTPEVPETYTSTCNIRYLVNKKNYKGFIVVPMWSATTGEAEYVVSKCKKSVCPLEVPVGTVACEYFCGKSSDAC